MSVINQMLNDLDSRSVQGKDGNIPHVKPYPTRNNQSFLYQGVRWFLLVAAIGAILWFLLSYFQQSSLELAGGPVDIIPAIQPALPSGQVSRVEDIVPVPVKPEPSTPDLSAEKISSSHQQAQLSIAKSLEVSGILHLEEAPISAEPEQSNHVVEVPAKAVMIQGDQQVPPKTEDAQQGQAKIKIVYRASQDEMFVRELLSDARRLTLDGAYTEAISLLKQALEVDGKLQEAREQLVTLLMQSDEPLKAGPWIDEGLYQAPNNELFVVSRSRLHVVAGDYPAAIETLTRAIKAGVTSVDVRSTLAALYQQTGKYSASASLYGQLLTADSSREVWWMGLAISLENTGEKKAALDAYRQAVYSGRLKPALADYARQRIAILNRI